MPERNAKHSDIIGTSVARANDCLWRDLVGNAYAWSKMRQGRTHIAIQTYAVLSGNQHFSGGKTLITALVLPVHVLREIDLPAQPVVDGQSWRDAPGVLDVGEETALPLSSVR